MNETQSKGLTSAKVRNFESPNSIAGSIIIFRKNMKEKEVKREIFIMEYDEGFDELGLKAKMMMVIKRSVPAVRDWFYEAGSEERLPETWEEFKKHITDGTALVVGNLNPRIYCFSEILLLGNIISRKSRFLEILLVGNLNIRILNSLKS